MASDTDLRRRVTRLENDTEAIYELIAEIRTTQLEHGTRLDDLQTTLTGRLDHHGTRLDDLQTTLTGRLDHHDTRLDDLQTTLDRHDTRLKDLQTGLAEVLRRLPEPR